MPTPKPKYNLTAQQAITEMRVQLAKMQAEADREQLKGSSPDDAFEMGYTLAIADLVSLTGPDPKVEYNDAAGRLRRGEIK